MQYQILKSHLSTSLKQFSVIAPKNFKIPKYKYIALPFDFYIGFLIFLSLIAFGLVSATIYKKYGKFDVIKQIIIGFLLLSNQSTQFPSKKQPLLRYMFILMIIFGLIVTNLYSAFLNSFLVTGVPKRISEIICYQHAFKVLHKKLPQFKFINLEYLEFDKEIKLFNSKKAYCVTDIVYEKLMYLKKTLIKDLYRLESPWITDITYSTYLLLRKDSKYKSELQNFISIAHSVGLIQKWHEKIASQQRRLFKFADQGIDEISLKVEDLRLAFLLILCGFLLSILGFIFEHLKSRKKKQSRKAFRKKYFQKVRVVKFVENKL